MGPVRSAGLLLLLLLVLIVTPGTAADGAQHAASRELMGTNGMANVRIKLARGKDRGTPRREGRGLLGAPHARSLQSQVSIAGRGRAKGGSKGSGRRRSTTPRKLV